MQDASTIIYSNFVWTIIKKVISYDIYILLVTLIMFLWFHPSNNWLAMAIIVDVNCSLIWLNICSKNKIKIRTWITAANFTCILALVIRISYLNCDHVQILWKIFFLQTFIYETEGRSSKTRFLDCFVNCILDNI